MGKFKTFIVAENGERVDFVLDQGKRKSCSLAIKEGTLIVRVPYYYNKDIICQMINNNIKWIKENLQRSADSFGLPISYENGEEIRLIGKIYNIEYGLSNKYFSPLLENGKLKIAVNKYSDKKYIINEVNKFIADLSQKEIKESMERLTKLTGLYPNKITVKSMTASWGRCNSKRNISINYKVITFPKSYIDYVCIHELCHLKHMDHSAEFWNEVEKYCSNWKEIRKDMRG